MVAMDWGKFFLGCRSFDLGSYCSYTVPHWREVEMSSYPPLTQFNQKAIYLSTGSRSSDKGGGGQSSRPGDERGAVSKKNNVHPFGRQFGLKIKGGSGLPGPSPLSSTVLSI